MSAHPFRYQIFVSFRTQDTGKFAKEFKRFLENHLPNIDVKTQYDIPEGVDWRDWIPPTIRDSHAVVCLIGSKWTLKDGLPHLHKSGDIVRLEIECALRGHRKGKPLMPLLVGITQLPKPLPKSIRHLARIEYKTTHRDFKSRREFLELVTGLYRKIEDLRPKPIVLLSSTLAFFGGGDRTEGLDYFTTLIMTLVQQLKTYHRDVILKVPIYADDSATVGPAQHQRELLQETIDNINHYCALVVAPFRLDYLCEEFVRLRKLKKKFPIFTIDKAYRPDDPSFAKRHQLPPVGVICDGHGNGRLAAQSVIAYCEDMPITNPTVVVLQGLQGSRERVLGFVREINKFNKGSLAQDRKIYSVISKETPFLGEKAIDMADQFFGTPESWSRLTDSSLQRLVKNPDRQPSQIDAFFCCNDEMALGVRDYLESKSSERYKVPTVVVGFDGIAEVRRRIAASDQWLLNTVDVKVHQQVDDLVSALERLLKGDGGNLQTTQVPGEAYHSRFKQRQHMEIIRERREEAARFAEDVRQPDLLINNGTLKDTSGAIASHDPING